MRNRQKLDYGVFFTPFQASAIMCAIILKSLSQACTKDKHKVERRV